MTPNPPEQFDSQVASPEVLAKALQRYIQLLAKSIAHQIVQKSEEQEAVIIKEANFDKD